MTDIATIPAIERVLLLRASPERVWRALTDPQELSGWFGQRCEFVPEVGAMGWMEWDDYGRLATRVEEAVAPRRLVIRWSSTVDAPFAEAASTLVEWDLEPVGDGTRLHLRESGFHTPDGRDGNAVGWLDELAELVAALAVEPWEAGIHRTWSLRASPDRVWQAFADPAEFESWWGGANPVELRPGVEGWWDWPSEPGRNAFRVEGAEPRTYLAWTWTVIPDASLDEAAEVLHTEWTFEARKDGATDLHLLETGFTGPENHRLNGAGWDGDVIPALRQRLDVEQA